MERIVRAAKAKVPGCSCVLVALFVSSISSCEQPCQTQCEEDVGPCRQGADAGHSGAETYQFTVRGPATVSRVVVEDASTRVDLEMPDDSAAWIRVPLLDQSRLPEGIVGVQVNAEIDVSVDEGSVFELYDAIDNHLLIALGVIGGQGWRTTGNAGVYLEPRWQVPAQQACPMAADAASYFFAMRVHADDGDVDVPAGTTADVSLDGRPYHVEVPWAVLDETSGVMTATAAMWERALETPEAK